MRTNSPEIQKELERVYEEFIRRPSYHPLDSAGTVFRKTWYDDKGVKHVEVVNAKDPR